MLMGWTLFSIFLLMEPAVKSVLTSSSTSLDMLERIERIELALVEFCLTLSSTWREMVEMLDWMELSLVMTLLGRIPSLFVWAIGLLQLCAFHGSITSNNTIVYCLFWKIHCFSTSQFLYKQEFCFYRLHFVMRTCKWTLQNVTFIIDWHQFFK